MAIFKTGVLTKKGQALLTKAQATGKGIELTRAVAGAGEYTDLTVAALEQHTGLIAPRQEFNFSDISIIEGNESVAVITVVIHNRGLEQLYYLNELGIFANDPDEGEILYTLLVSEGNLIYLPPDNETGGISTITERIYIEVANAERTTINMTGALVSATDFQALRQIVDAVIANLRGGNAGQMLTKDARGDYLYSWKDINTVTRPFANFPETGRPDAIYIDTDSSEIYVWKTLADTGEPSYFKLPLGSEASQTLQRQITVNADNIALLVKRVSLLEASQEELYVRAGADWALEIFGDVSVYTQEIAIEGMTANYDGTVYPHVQSTDPAAIVEEMKAISTFFGRGMAESAEGKLVLTCYGKVPRAAFGIRLKAS